VVSETPIFGLPSLSASTNIPSADPPIDPIGLTLRQVYELQLALRFCNSLLGVDQFVEVLPDLESGTLTDHEHFTRLQCH
jgi:hypothetical protein